MVQEEVEDSALPVQVSSHVSWLRKLEVEVGKFYDDAIQLGKLFMKLMDV